MKAREESKRQSIKDGRRIWRDGACQAHANVSCDRRMHTRRLLSIVCLITPGTLLRGDLSSSPIAVNRTQKLGVLPWKGRVEGAAQVSEVDGVLVMLASSFIMNRKCSLVLPLSLHVTEPRSEGDWLASSVDLSFRICYLCTSRVSNWHIQLRRMPIGQFCLSWTEENRSLVGLSVIRGEIKSREGFEISTSSV